MAPDSAAPDIIVTAALPYANGPIHIGHLVEYIQTDIYVRYLKLAGKNAVYCCADDTHGTAIEISAEKAGVTPEEYIARWQQAHQESFARYAIAFDSYYSTNSEENRELSEQLYAALKAGGHIYQKDVEQLYDEEAGRFLPDRYVKGECPECGAPDQYGDVCEKCNATYKPTDLVNPYSTLTKSTPVLKTSTHFFFALSKHSDFLKTWLANERLQPEIRNQIMHWVEKGLEDWCISRDAPYFGFKIPGTDKYFYVWLDAPVGYISSLAHLLGGTMAAREAWNHAEIQHFIGKDIIYFHLLFWPAVLHAAGWKVPDNLIVHGFLTVNGEKMSKSRGTFLSADEFADKVPDTEFLRFYYAANLSHAMTDLDLNLKDFTQRVNTELVGNIANFVYRTLSFIEKNYGGELTKPATDERARQLLLDVQTTVEHVVKHYNTYEFRKAVQGILKVSQLGNQYFQESEPWKHPAESQDVLTTCANLVRDLSIICSPILPRFAERVQQQLGLAPQRLADLSVTLEHTRIGKPAIIWRRMEPLVFGKPEATSGAAPAGAVQASAAQASTAQTNAKTPDILDLIVAKITNVEKHPKADKLYIETLDDGSGSARVIVSGLVPYYTADELVGKHIILVNNLKPAKLRGVESKGMLLAVQQGDDVKLIEAPDARPGDAVTI
ncbi:methionine--tRNA ligase, partial [Candidatus Woesearchaeota archaeon]